MSLESRPDSLGVRCAASVAARRLLRISESKGSFVSAVSERAVSEHAVTNSAAGSVDFGQRVLATAAGTLIAAPVIYLAAVMAGYAKAGSRPLYVAVIPLVVIGAMWAARHVVRDGRPEVFYIAAVGGAVAAVLTTAVATWFHNMATDLSVSAAKAIANRDFAIGIGNSRDAAERLHWSEITGVFGVCAVLFLTILVAATTLSPAGRKVVRAGSVDRVALATVAAAALTIVVCGWLLYRL